MSVVEITNQEMVQMNPEFAFYQIYNEQFSLAIAEVLSNCYHYFVDSESDDRVFHYTVACGDWQYKVSLLYFMIPPF